MSTISSPTTITSTLRALDMEKERVILILTPDLNNICGVAGYFNTLSLHHGPFKVEYFEINKAHKEGKVAKLFRMAFNYLQFTIKILTNSYELVHINPSFNKRSFLRDTVFCGICLLFRKKIVVLFHGWEDDFEKRVRTNKVYRFLFRHTFMKAANYVVLSSIFKDKLASLGVVPSSRFWINTTAATPPQTLSLSKKLDVYQPDEIHLLFIARIVKGKGMYIAVDAFEQVKKKVPDCNLHLHIAGEGNELASVKDYVRGLDYQNIHFHGYVLSQEKDRLFMSSDIMLFPTFYPEGLPTSIMEGMMYGLPIVSRSNAGIPDVVEHEINGFLSESKDPSVFAAFLHKIITSPELYKRIAQANHLKAINNFSSQHVKQRILSVYQEVIDN
ncbi:glycosyltransferase family 4 protein [Tunicatimonas pelagia]|uniref:glycosyltransferase family 4 protein n=1 Tax=Tunicatimonas pelagia TaxID=931531 RepID=UPI002666D5AE|nr:glycosyltransferase family 4 protein [Tunicatimonas pelagia]WKN41975.1 glycosyltransferase family 4 protein [Tunicatimonas pelagia]